MPDLGLIGQSTEATTTKQIDQSTSKLTLLNVLYGRKLPFVQQKQISVVISNVCKEKNFLF